jgi:flagellar biosynthetic protein FlhB
MAGDNKTEKATPKKKSEARKKGQVAKSADLNTAFVMLAATAALIGLAPSMLGRYEDLVREGLSFTADPSLASDTGLQVIVRWGLEKGFLLVLPIALCAMVAGVLTTTAQIGFKVTPTALKPSVQKLNPLPGLKRIFGKDGLVEALKSIAKVATIAAVGFFTLWPEIPRLATLVGLTPTEILATLGTMIKGVALRVSLAFLVIGVLDLIWQKRKHEKQLKMTKDEVKQEARQADLPPEVRGQIRRKQFEQARKRMLADVPTADVVVVNPTHYAVALRYDGEQPAPQVIAKGVDLVAKAIREVAEEHDVPIVSNPPLTRALYKEVELGHMIPDDFFQAVAEVLAFVYRTFGRRARPRPRPAERLALGPGPRGLKPSANASI